MRDARTRASPSSITWLVANGKAASDRSFGVSDCRNSRARGPITDKTPIPEVTLISTQFAHGAWCELRADQCDLRHGRHIDQHAIRTRLHVPLQPVEVLALGFSAGHNQKRRLAQARHRE